MKRKFLSTQLLSILAFILLIAGCKKADDDLGTTGVCPRVVSTNPANSATGVMLNAPIIARFNEAMNLAAFTSSSFVVKQGANVVAGAISYADTSAVFTPTTDLLPLTVYTATLKAGLKDPYGNAMIADYSWSFTTGKLIDIIAPTVISNDPLNGATNVAIAKVISVEFSEAMDPATLLTAFTVSNTTAGGTAVAGVVSYLNNTAYFTPTSPLANNNVYAVSITTGAKDLPGNPLASTHNFSFTTVAVVDVPPTVLSTSPVNMAILVEPNAVLSVSFSETMNNTTVNAGSFTLTQAGLPVTGTVLPGVGMATFTPASNLLYSTLYTATITTGVQDLTGNNMLVAHSWTFTTKSNPVLPPAIGTLINFGAFGGTAGITNEGIFTVVNNGAIATTAASTLVTGFHDGLTAAVYTETPLNVGDVKGGIFTAPPAPGDAISFDIAKQALLDASALYTEISPTFKPGGIDPGAGELGGLTLNPGLYKSAGGSFKITNLDLTLDAQGDPNAIFIFQAPTSLTVGIPGPAGARSVVLINGAQAKNVFWWVGSAATINGAGGGIMAGTIISLSGVTFSTAGNTVQTVHNGKAISLIGSVTMVNTTINVQ